MDKFWRRFFLKQKHSDIAWQSQEVITHASQLKEHQPIISLRRHSDLALNAVQLFICTQDQDDLFAATVNVLDQMGLSVLDATILTADIDGISAALDSYVLIDRYAIGAGNEQDNILTNDIRRQMLIDNLSRAFKDGKSKFAPRRFSLDSQLRHFSVPTQVQFSEATSLTRSGQHMMFITTKDRPTLLAKLGNVFSQLNIEVHGARITTLGERAEDIFYLSDKHKQVLSSDKLNALKIAVIDVLS